MKNKKKGLLHIIVILAVIALCSFYYFGRLYKSA